MFYKRLIQRLFFLASGPLLLLAALFLPHAAYAGLITNAPNYLGLNDGLVGYWSFDGKDMAGVTAFDRSGQGNNGTLVNGPTPTFGKIGQALSFDGVDDHVDITNEALFDFESTDSFSISAWMNTRDVSAAAATQAIFGKVDVGNNYRGYDLTFNQLAAACNLDSLLFDLFSTFYSDGFRVCTPTGSISKTNTWYHVALTYSGTKTPAGVAIYINGISQPITININNAPISGTTRNNVSPRIGDDYESDPFNGTLDDVRLYTRVLSPDEIKRLYRIGGTLKINAPISTNGTLSNGLVGYWSFDGPTMGTTSAVDLSGNGNTGWLINGPTRTFGNIGQALNFDGSSGEMVHIASASPWNGAYSTYTVAFWERIKGGGDYSVVYHVGPWTGSNTVYYMSDGTWVFDLQNAGGTAGGVCHVVPSAATTSFLSNGRFHHVAIVFDSPSGLCTVYADGSSLATDQSVDGTTSFGQQPLCLGAECGGNNRMIGDLDDFRLYNRALSPDEIKRLYRIGGTLKVNAPISTNGTLSQGLVGYWSFDGSDMAGVTAYDRSGQGNNGTLINGPTRTFGKIGQALYFDGVNDYVDAGTASSFPFIQNTAIFTISLWVKFVDYKTVPQYFMGSTPTCGDKGFYFGENAVGQLHFEIEAGACPGGMASDVLGVINNNNWNHIVVTGNGTNIVFYVNGVSYAGSGTMGAPGSGDSTRSLNIGQINNFGSSLFNGTIDDVRIYNRVLSPDEIKRLYNMGNTSR